jgi:pimeloyl-ACP methyl ester carboxylesterase
MRGSDDSEHTVVGYSVEQFAQDLHDFTEALRLDCFQLVGHSLCGTVALQYAVKYSNRLQSLFLLSTAPSEGMRVLFNDFKIRFRYGIDFPQLTRILPSLIS